MGPAPYRLLPDGLLLAVRLTPRGGRDALDKVDVLADGTAVIGARVRAVPQDGEANRALEKLVAKAFDVATSQVMVDKGATSRVKMLRISGDPDRLAKLAAGLFGLVALFLVAIPADGQAQGLGSETGRLDVCSSRAAIMRSRAIAYRAQLPVPQRARLIRTLQVGERLAEEGCGKRDAFLIKRATGMVNAVNQELRLPPIDLPNFVAD